MVPRISITGPAAHFPTLFFLESDLISSRNLRKNNFPSNVKTEWMNSTRKSDNRCRWYSVWIFLGGMPQRSIHLPSPIWIPIKRYGVCMIYYTGMYKVKILRWDPQNLRFSHRFYFLEVLHAFLTGKTNRFITAQPFFPFSFFVSFGQEQCSVIF